MCLSDTTPSLHKSLEQGHSKTVYLPVGTLDPVVALEGKRGRGRVVDTGVCSF